MRRTIVVALALSTLVASAACGDLKLADDDNADSAAPSDDGSRDDDSGAIDGAAVGSETSSGGNDAGAAADGAPDPLSGPGPHGSLPSGYCCTADTDCRYRRCVDTGGAGGKMCLDECFTQAFCKRPDLDFACVLPDAGGRGLCGPPAGFACLAASTFKRGTSPIGACCNAGDPALADGTTASHCEGYQCVAVGSSPLVCTHRCAVAQDCPGGFQCIPFGTSKACVPTNAGNPCN